MGRSLNPYPTFHCMHLSKFLLIKKLDVDICLYNVLIVLKKGMFNAFILKVYFSPAMKAVSNHRYALCCNIVMLWCRCYWPFRKFGTLRTLCVHIARDNSELTYFMRMMVCLTVSKTFRSCSCPNVPTALLPFLT